MKPLFACRVDETARIYDLVLRSAGIPCQLHPYRGFWAIYVPPSHRRKALRAISLYLKENPPPPSTGRTTAAPGVTTWSALYIAPILGVIHWAIQPGYEQQVFVERLGADAEQIVSGGLYRCVTALFLHKDWLHVVNNMVGVLLFGTVAASVCGWGVGWLMILISGALGNLLTAVWYRQDHLAIGASTAVFGALGICVALNLWWYARLSYRSWRMWLPLAGGLGLLGLLGTSPHSDLMAHLAGFGCGLLIGAAYGACRLRPWKVGVQFIAAAAGMGMIALSWIWGIQPAGG
jgi:membrane associated rhomboid family serine protease